MEKAEKEDEIYGSEKENISQDSGKEICFNERELLLTSERQGICFIKAD